jgi:hypothetical protein
MDNGAARSRLASLAVADKPQAKPLWVRGGAIRFSQVSHHYGRGEGGLDRLSLDVAAGPAGKSAYSHVAGYRQVIRVRIVRDAVHGHSTAKIAGSVGVCIVTTMLNSGPYWTWPTMRK